MQHQVANAGAVTRSTTATNSTGTPLLLSNVTIDLDGSGLSSADTWTIKINDALVTTAAVTGLTSLDLIAAAFRTELAKAAFSGAVKDVGGTGHVIEFNSVAATGVTVAITINGVNPQGSATITGRQAGQAVAVLLGGTPHEGEKWSLTVAGQKYERTVSLGDTPITIADDLRSQFGAVTGAGLQFSNVVDDGAGKITFTFNSDWTGDRQVGGLVVTAQPDDGTLSATATAVASLTLTGVSALATDDWKLALTGVADLLVDDNSFVGVDAKAGDLLTKINGTGTYTATYASSILTIWRTTGSIAFTATLSVNATANPVVNSAPAYRVVLGGTIREGQAWKLDLSGAVTDPSYPIALGSTLSFNQVAASLADLVNAQTGYDISAVTDAGTGASFFIFGPVGFTVTSPDVIVAASAGTSIVTGAVPIPATVTSVNWTTIDVQLGGTPHQGEYWALTVGGQTMGENVPVRAADVVGLLETVADIAADLAAQFSALSGPADPFTSVVDNGDGKITFTFKPTWTGDRQVGGLVVTAQPDDGTLSATATAAARLTLTGVSALSDDNWQIALGGTTLTPDVTSNSLTGVDDKTTGTGGLLAVINANGTGYTATYEDATHLLTIWRNAGTASFTAVLSVKPSGGSFAPALTVSSAPAYRIVLGGTIREGQAWNLDLSGIASDPSFTVPVIDSGSNPSHAFIATSTNGLIAQINSAANTTAGYSAVLSGSSDLFIFGPTGFTVTADVVVAAPLATATVEGTLAPNWQTIVTPDTAGYGSSFTTGDVWSFTGAQAGGYKVGTDFTSPATASLAAFLAKAFKDAHSSVTAVANGDGTITVTNGGAVVDLGDLKWTRAHPFESTPATQAYTSAVDWTGAAHYFQAIVNLQGTSGYQDVAGGEIYSVTINGQKVLYQVNKDLPTGGGAGGLNFGTVATELAKNISDEGNRAGSLLFGYAAEATGAEIRVYDKKLARDATKAGGGHGINPFAFASERGGDVAIVLDIDNTRLVQGTKQFLIDTYEEFQYNNYIFLRYDPVFSHNTYNWWDIFRLNPIPVYQQVPVYRVEPVYRTVSIYETVKYTISPRLELIDPSKPAGSQVIATAQYTPDQIGTPDSGSADLFDPLLRKTVEAPTSNKTLLVRLSSVVTYEKGYGRQSCPMLPRASTTT
ncbi:MAG: hypothetical protein IPK39_05830 [Sulfuritalea sp.]|nr:hypothetical protein [Sulfuritalea sp.]